MPRHPVMDEVHRLIGAICVQATALEHELEDTVLSLAGSPARGEALVRGERGNTLLTLVKRLLDEDRSGSDPAHLLGLVGHARKLLERRDKATHSRSPKYANFVKEMVYN